MKQKGATTEVEEAEAPTHDATTNVVDFMALLKKSIGAKTRTPAAKSTATRKTAAKKAPAKKAPAKKAAKKTASRKAPSRRRAG